MALTNLTDTKWEFPSEVGLSTIVEDANLDVDFWSNGTLFSGMSIVADTETIEEEEVTVHKMYYGDTLILDDRGESSVTVPAEYRVVEIVGGADVASPVALYFFTTGSGATRIDIIENLHVQQMDNLDGTFKERDFGSVKGLEFLVKNMSDAAIQVAFDDTGASGIIVIPANTAQVVLTNLQYPRKAFSKIYVKGTGEGFVEVQVILW